MLGTWRCGRLHNQHKHKSSVSGDIEMSLQDNFESLFTRDEDVSSEKIVQSFYDKKNINMKTELPKQMILPMAILEKYAKIMKEMKLTKAAKLTAGTIDLTKELMVSAEREGRKEGVSMLGAIKQQIAKTGAMAKILGAAEG